MGGAWLRIRLRIHKNNVIKSPGVSENAFIGAITMCKSYNVVNKV
jgi:hypothetical protein